MYYCGSQFYILLMKLTFQIIILLLISIQDTNAQCSILSSNGYTVHISITPTVINASASCPGGYNFTVDMDYDISFTGPNAPSSMWTLNTTLTCGSFTGLYADLPNTGGTGVTTTNISTWNNDTDCATATVASLGCTNLVIEIQGPGIPTQTIDCSPIVAPVEFNSFSVNKRNGSSIELKWETASEVNNDYFQVEKSKDLSNWVVIDRIQGADYNSYNTIYYKSTDKNPYIGKNYYRIKQVDSDGKFSYSDVRSIFFDKDKNNSLTIYPNPVDDNLYIEGGIDEFSDIQIFNTFGQLVLNLQNQSTKSTSSYDLSSLSSGTYILKTNTNTKLFVKR